MQLNLQTDYALRTLILLACQPDRRFGIAQIADSYRISRSHLTKIVPKLQKQGWIRSVPGPGGGISLVEGTERLSIAEVVAAFEPQNQLVECFNPAANTCPIAPACGLKRVLARAEGEFMKSLSQTTVADIAKPKARIAELLELRG